MSEIERYVSHLGISRDDLRGKFILDVGAGYAGFAEECMKSGIAKVVSVEPDQQCFRMRRQPLLESMVCARAEALPFRDETFDLVVAHFSVPMLCRTQEEVYAVFDEMCRVVKRGGEIRIVPIIIDDMNADEELQNWIGEKFAQISCDVRYHCVRGKAYASPPAFPGKTIEYAFCAIIKKP